MRKIGIILCLIFLLPLLLVGCASKNNLSDKPVFIGDSNTSTTPQTTEKIKLVYGTQWTDIQLDGIVDKDGTVEKWGLKHYLDEYTALHPDIEFEILPLAYENYVDTLTMMHQTDSVPDIIQSASLWDVSLVQKGMLAKAPDNIKEQIVKNYVSTTGVTVGGEIYGIPT
jgi:ABC-type glycerol-3-phosphate transport system substrate-binding protein